MKKYACKDFVNWASYSWEEDFPADVDRIVSAMESSGYEIDRRNAEAAWARMSTEDYCAGWLILEGYDNESILRMLMPHMEEERPGCSGGELEEIRRELEAMRDVMCRDCWDEYNRRLRGK